MDYDAENADIGQEKGVTWIDDSQKQKNILLYTLIPKPKSRTTTDQSKECTTSVCK